ncbi:MAG: aminopeptidase P family protein [Alphaproteobacteria bacterium]
MSEALALERTEAAPHADRLARLRLELARRGLRGFLIPRTDEHQGEYVAARSERLAWLTGFTGSAGLAVVLSDRAAIFVDGRYTLQVQGQVDTTAFEPRHVTDAPPGEWLADLLRPEDRLGFDPWLHTRSQLKPYRAACERAGAELVALDTNPLDAVWADQPEAPLAPVERHDLRFAGKPSEDKRAEVARSLAKAGVAAAVLTAPDSINWLLNIRGGDIPHTPVALAFAIVDSAGAVELFIDARKVSPDVRRHLGPAVTVSEPESFGSALDALGRSRARVQVDPMGAAEWIFARLEKTGAVIVPGRDPCALPKACKNEVELRGAYAAHLRDGAALTRFLAWLSRAAPESGVDELGAAAKLAQFRAENALLKGASFPTISGAGPNGAVVHYRVSAATNRTLLPGEIYLVDSGAQYLDGTTDVTRAVFIPGKGAAEPTAEMRDRYTRVLKGHIAVATAKFPKGTTGQQLDALARRALWDAGLDFDHGTGHGVGSYLGVHEGPQRIAKIGSDVALRPGMIVSNEPGYYKEGAYGIRLENLVTVVALAGPSGAEREMLGFDTLTVAPFDRALVDPALMTEDETAWLDAYHARVRDSLMPLVDRETGGWLLAATKPLGQD